jgi:hypothetical protein
VHDLATRTFGKAGPDRSRVPYYGTGVVRWVDQTSVGIDFGEMSLPQHGGMTLLVIRNGRIVGKIRTISGGTTSQPREWTPGFLCVSGSVHVSDNVIGIQNERKYKEEELLP